MEREEYDKQGHLLQYDENNILTKKTFFNRDGTIMQYDVYEYNADGNQIKTTKYREDGTFLVFIIHEYGANNEKERSTRYQEDGTPGGYTLYEYDEDTLSIQANLECFFCFIFIKKMVILNRV